MIVGKIKRTKQDIYWAYIDYKKTFDSVPHSWLKEILEIYKITPAIVSTLNTMMKEWQTNINFQNSKIEEIKRKKGIFQGDSLSDLWFCLTLNPLSTILNSMKSGFRPENSSEKIEHLIHMWTTLNLRQQQRKN